MLNGIHICKRNVTKSQYTHSTSQNNSEGFKNPTLTKGGFFLLSGGQIIETKTKQRLTETNRRYEPNVFNRYVHNISP